MVLHSCNTMRATGADIIVAGQAMLRNGGVMHFLLFYDLAPDYLERRGQYRELHLAHAWEAHGRGELVLGGALADPADVAVLLFEAESPETAERFAEATLRRL